MLRAIGLIETKGLVAAIEALDAALKAANVSLLKQEKSTGGLITIAITGDVGAVKAAVEAGASAASRIGVLVSAHVIPRLSSAVYPLLASDKADETADDGDPHSREVPGGENQSPLLQAQGAAVVSDLSHYKVIELRHMARDMGIQTMARNKIKFANKEQLIEAIEAHMKGGSS